MPAVVKPVALAVLALLGLALTGVGLWFAVSLGGSGSATFTTQAGPAPRPGGPVVIGPDVLNRLDVPVRVEARARDGRQVWIGRSTPSDAEALLGRAPHALVTGVSVARWRVHLEPAGPAGASGRATAGPGADTLMAADIWRQSVTGAGRAAVLVHPHDAPETLVIATASGEATDLASVTLTWQRGTWFAMSLVAALAGLLLASAVVAGLWLLRRTGPRRDPSADPPTDPRTGSTTAPAAPAGDQPQKAPS